MPGITAPIFPISPYWAVQLERWCSAIAAAKWRERRLADEMLLTPEVIRVLDEMALIGAAPDASPAPPDGV